MAQPDYNAIMEDAVKKLWEYKTDERDWKHLKTVGDISIYQKKSTLYDGMIYKVERTMDISPQRLIELSFDWNFLATAEKDVKAIELVEHIGGPDNLKIIRTTTDSALLGLISAREFISMPGVRHYPMKKLHLIAHVSVDHPKFPVDKKMVRGTIHPSGRFMYEIDGEPNKCRIVEFGQTDPKVSIPNIVMQQAIPSAFKAKIDHFNKALQAATK